MQKDKYRRLYCTFFESYSNLGQILTHLARRPRDKVVATFLCSSHRRRRYISNETPNASAERHQDVSVVRLHDVMKERRDNVSRVHYSDVLLEHIHDVSN